MHKLLTLLASFSLVLLASCAHTAAGLGQTVGTVALPTGVTLLESHQAQCNASVQMGQASIQGASLGDNLYVRPGQNGTFEVKNDAVKWACTEGNSPEVQTLSCPDDTKYVRVTRSQATDNTLFECFG